MLGKEKIRVVMDIGCSAIRLGVIEEKEGREARFLVLDQEAFPAQGRLLDNPQAVSQALERLRERLQREHQLVVNSAYVGLRGGLVQSISRSGEIVSSRSALNAKEISTFFQQQEARYQVADAPRLLHLSPLGLAVRDEERGTWKTLSLSDVAQVAKAQAWWVEWLALPEGERVMREISSLGQMNGIDGFYAHRYALSRSALRVEERQSKVLLVDLGASGTEYSLIKQGSVVFSGHVAEGGFMLSTHLARQLNLSYHEAEQGKIAGEWAETVEKLYRERLFKPLKSALLQARADGLTGLTQVILFGGGATPLAVAVAEQIFGVATRLAEVDKALWHSRLPDAMVEQEGSEHLNDYLPLLGVYQWWYDEQGEEWNPRAEDFKQKMKNWWKKLIY